MRTVVLTGILLIVAFLTGLAVLDPGTPEAGTEGSFAALSPPQSVVEADPVVPPVSGKPPIIFITVDTLRADHVGCIGDQMRTPAICRLAANGTVFERAYSQIPITLPSFSTVFTGQYPSELGLYFNGRRLPDPVTTLAEQLSAAGYETAAFTSLGVLDARYGLNQGFSSYWTITEPRHWFGKAERVNTRVFDYLNGTRSKPLFLWVHYSDPHEPYLNASRRRGMQRFTLEELRQYGDIADIRGKYRSEVRYTDRAVERLIGRLKAEGLYDDALIVFLADHGENLAYSGGGFGHQNDLHNSQVHVPLIVKLPGQTESERVETPVGLIDVTPTIEYLLDRPQTRDITLFTPIEDRWVYSETYPYMVDALNKKSITNGTHRLIVHETGLREVFHSATDYYENTPLNVSADAFESRMGSAFNSVPEQERDDDLRDRLRALGYAQ